MEIGQVIKVNKMIHEGDYDSAKKICQEFINEFLEYYVFDKFNLDLNMAGTADIGDDMLEQYKKEYKSGNYKSEFIYTFNISKYSDTSPSLDWNNSTKNQILCILIGIPYRKSNPPIIDNYYCVKNENYELAYELIIEDKEKVTIKFDLEKMA